MTWTLPDPATTDGTVIAVNTSAGFKVTSASKWGVTGDRPYYNSTGVTAGDDATYIAESRPLLRT